MVQQFTQGLIELEAEQKIGAARHEHSSNRQAERNGYRQRGLATRVGDLELRTPALRPTLARGRLRAGGASRADARQALAQSRYAPMSPRKRCAGLHELLDPDLFD